MIVESTSFVVRYAKDISSLHFQQVLVHLDVARAMGDGLRFFTSANGVILTSGLDGTIPPIYFEKVVLAKPPHTILYPQPGPSVGV